MDVGSSAIKIISLTQSKRGVSIIDTADYPVSAVPNPDERGGEDLSLLLQEAGRAAGIKQTHVVTALDHQKVILRHILVPRMPRRELARAIKWEAEKYVPLPVNDLILRYLVLGTKEIDGAVQFNLLLVAAPRQAVYAYYESFARAGFTIAAIDLPVLALWRVFGGVIAPAPAPGAYGVLDIGLTAAQLIAIRQNKLLFVRTLPVGSKGINEAGSPGAAELPGANTGTGGAFQVISGKAGTLSPAPSGAAVIPNPEAAQGEHPGQANLSGLVAEIRRSLDFYRLQERDLPLEKLLLTGGGSKINGLADFLGKELGMPVEPGVPLLPVPGKPGEVQPVDPALAVAAGLALREVIR